MQKHRDSEEDENLFSLRNSPEFEEFFPVDSFFNDYVKYLEENKTTLNLNEPTSTSTLQPNIFNNAHDRSDKIMPPFDDFFLMDVLGRDRSIGDQVQDIQRSRRILENTNFSNFETKDDSEEFIYSNQQIQLSNPFNIYGNETEIPIMPFSSNTNSSAEVTIQGNLLADQMLNDSRYYPASYMGESIDGLTSLEEPLIKDKNSDKGRSAKIKSRYKTVRQQHLNKLAQQRYREKKKSKAMELERTVDILTGQVKSLQKTKEEKEALDIKNMYLEKRLMEQQAEIDELKIKLEKQDKESCCGSNTSQNSLTETCVKDAKQFHTKVSDLKMFLHVHKLDPKSLPDPYSAQVPEDIINNIWLLMEDVHKICMRVVRLAGPNMWDLISAKIEKVYMKPHALEKWLMLIESIKLSEEQKREALKLRSDYIAKIEKNYIERQSLNLKAIGLLLPSDQGGQAPSLSAAGCFNVASFFQRTRHSSKTRVTLHALKKNLNEEQKFISEYDYLVFQKLLNPIQGAWAIIGAYPHHCDCLEFLNAVNELYGQS